MRKLIAITGIMLALVGTASAQQFSSGVGPPPKPGSFSVTGNTSSFLAQSMARPNMTAAMMTRPAMASPLNIFNMLPTFNMQNTMLMRNVFGGSSVQMPKQPTPPPKKK